MPHTNLKRVVIIGCSGAGAIAALSLKKLCDALDVTIIREPDEQGLLTRCATPYICCGEVMVEPSYKNDSMFTVSNIKLVNVRAEYVNSIQKTVTTADGEIYEYDKLVLATGATPITLQVPGIDLRGVFTLRKSDDAVNIQHWMNAKRVKSVVLIGAGPIGLEVAYLTARHGVKVYVVDMLEHVLQQVLDPDMSVLVEEHISKQGVNLRLKQSLERIDGDGEIHGVTLSSGETVQAQMVLICAGVRPNSELAEQAGLQMGRLGLKVNRYLQTSDPDIYAGGDLIEYPHWVTGKPAAGRLRPNAVIAGRVMARNILGGKTEYPGFINGFATKFFDKSIAGTGLTQQQAAVEGIETISATQSATTMHSMMRARRPYTVKLIFEKRSEQIIGGQIVSDGESPIRHIDVITTAMRGRLTASDVATLCCAGQPELSSDPGREPIALAAEQVLNALKMPGRIR
jgi:NADH oxidase (H2O2-forming)